MRANPSSASICTTWTLSSSEDFRADFSAADFSAICVFRSSTRFAAAMLCCTTASSSGSAICSGAPAAFRSKPTAHESSVVTTTAISTPGIFGAYFLRPHMMAMASAPIAKVGIWVSPINLITPMMSLIKCSLRPIGTPNNFDNCDSAMMMAAALVKPTMTGCDRKLTITPSLNTPSAS